MTPTLNDTRLGEDVTNLIQSSREYAMALGGIPTDDPLADLEERFDADVAVLQRQLKAEPFGYFWEHAPKDGTVVVNNGFHTIPQLKAMGIDPSTVPDMIPVKGMPGFFCHFTPLYLHENP